MVRETCSLASVERAVARSHTFHPLSMHTLAPAECTMARSHSTYPLLQGPAAEQQEP